MKPSTAAMTRVETSTTFVEAMTSSLRRPDYLAQLGVTVLEELD